MNNENDLTAVSMRILMQERPKEISLDEFEAWRDSQPDSPIPITLRTSVRSAYALMEHRIRLGNQIYAQARSRLGIPPGGRVSDDAKAAKLLEDMTGAYTLMTEGLARSMSASQFGKRNTGVFYDFAEFLAFETFLTILRQEKRQFKGLTTELKKIPVYNEFLLDVPGCGPALSACLLAWLNPRRARHVSSFWRFAGLDLADDGTGRSNRKTHNEEAWTKTVNPDGTYSVTKVARKTHDPFLKAKVVGVGGETFLKAGVRWVPADDALFENTPDQFRRVIPQDDGPPVKKVAVFKGKYALMYYDYKHRKTHSRELTKVWRRGGPDGNGYYKEVMWCETTDSHRHRAAVRFMMKAFLADLWVKWRELEGLPVSKPYAEEFLGRRPHGRDAVV